jgi:alpha-galactosidase
MKPLIHLLLLLLCSASSTLAHAEALQVYLLVGQSNMQGHAQVRTFPHLGMDPATAPLPAEMQNPDGSPTVCERVWISSLGTADQEQTGKLTVGFGAANNGPKIGPEFTFGLTIQKYVPGRILIIKTACGGKSLHTDFRPPRAGPYVFNDAELANIQKQGKNLDAVKAEKATATGVYYRLMIDHVKLVLADLKRVVPEYEAKEGYELAGMVWFQGWNDMVDGGTYPNRGKVGRFDAYSEVLANFIRDVRKDLAAPTLPFVIGVLGVGGPTAEYLPDQQRYLKDHQVFRDAMARPAKLQEFSGTVAAVLTERYWDRELTQLRAKENVLRQAAKKSATGGKSTPAEERAAFEKLRAEQLSEHERTVLDTGVSNAEYHYLGSAKILGGIGKGLAEAMATLKQLNTVTP